jgi:uncharacterized membrane protein YbhN (UPF0104 family)
VIWLHAAALGLVVGDLVIRATRLRLLAGAGWRGSLWQAITVNAWGDAAAAVTPARVGGDAARFLCLRRHGVAAPGAVVVLATERIVDLALAALVVALAFGGFGSRSVGGLVRVADRLGSDAYRPWLIGVAALVAAAAVGAHALRGRILASVAGTIREAVAQTRRLSARALSGTTLLTAASIASRVAILPVLLRGYGPVPDLIAVLLGSFGLLYGQQVLPTPAGAGGVELAFVAGAARVLSGGEIAGLVVAWRVYTLVLPAGLGLALFLRDRFAAAPASR